MHKWELFDPANALLEVPIVMLASIAKGMYDLTEDARRYIRVGDLYDNNYRIEASEQVLELGGPVRLIGVVSDKDEEFLIRQHSGMYGWVQQPLSDPAFLEELTGLLDSVSGEKFDYQLWTNSHRAAVVRVPVIEPEVAPAVTPPEDAPDWNNCLGKDQPHIFVATIPLPTIGEPYMANNYQLCARCHGVFYTSEIPKNLWPS